MSRVLVIGNATIDLILPVASLPAPGETVLAGQALRCAGGKGLNQALAASRLGIPTTLLAPVGEDPDGRFLADAMVREGLHAQWITSGHPTDLSIVAIAAGGENLIISTAASAQSMTPETAECAASALQPADILVLQGNLCEATTVAAHRTAQSKGAKTIFNTAPIAWDQAELAADVDVVVANAGEALHLTGLQGEAAAVRLVEAGARAAIVTRGAAPTILAAEAGVSLLPIAQVDAVDTSGAGDVTVGVLAAGLARGMTLERALELALSAASLSVTRHGTSPSFPSASELAVLGHR